MKWWSIPKLYMRARICKMWAICICLIAGATIAALRLLSGLDDGA